MVADYPAPGAAPVGGPQVAVSRLVPELVRRGLEVIVVAPAPGSVATERYEARRRRRDDSHADGDSVVASQTASALEAASCLGDREPQPGSCPWTGPDPRRHRGRGRGSCPAHRDGARKHESGHACRVPRLGGISRAYVREGLARKGQWSEPMSSSASTRTGPSTFRGGRGGSCTSPTSSTSVSSARSGGQSRGLFFSPAAHERSRVGRCLRKRGPRCKRPFPKRASSPWAGIGEPPSKPVLGHGDPITFESWLSSEQLAVRMSKASLLVVASEFEVSPIVVAEAWAVGLPVVATSVGGLRSLVEGAGVLVSRRRSCGSRARHRPTR